MSLFPVSLVSDNLTALARYPVDRVWLGHSQKQSVLLLSPVSSSFSSFIQAASVAPALSHWCLNLQCCSVVLRFAQILSPTILASHLASAPFILLHISLCAPIPHRLPTPWNSPCEWPQEGEKCAIPSWFYLAALTTLPSLTTDFVVQSLPFEHLLLTFSR